ncbi:nitroreductase family protein [Bacteroides reticulotermitis]|uniref:Nitroreductase domain-containing protein n=2 Tax=Bacteroides reticulotermitis TaxID=1133319 RepID=W4UV81_9BACE|nr:nitroreductase family protein [Bacteroides reticulotermitis]MBB4045537.1 nitroreductase [Bacteroides reticulotermitis]GAE84493.1 hypothetical protein JCM10512_2838 [Bacteroides reticulotermitis JCM 10512]
MLKSYLKQSKLVLFFRIFHEKLYEIKLYAKFIANGKRYKDPIKLRTDLMIRTHAIEKGMSMGSMKVGFGRPKVLSLINDLQHFVEINGDVEFVEESVSIINQYLIFNEKNGADMQEVRDHLDRLCERNCIIPQPSFGGILNLDFSETKRLSLLDFGTFSQSRYSIRDFSDIPIDLEIIKSALKLCERTPSACNRQSWRIYVFCSNSKRLKLFNLQEGCKGFSSKMQYGILVCGDLSSYNINELHQVYVDGGLYAMNLMYALHYLGVANIPLTMGHKQKYINNIKRQLNIPENEIPIVLIGVGSYKEKYKVAVSHRTDYMKYTQFI